MSRTETLAAIEKKAILAALAKHGWNVTATAKALDVSRKGLYLKIVAFKITRPKA